jgi:hypothetical protein
MTDSVIYWVIMALLLGFIGWLLLVPAPGHDPLIALRHSGLLA